VIQAVISHRFELMRSQVMHLTDSIEALNIWLENLLQPFQVEPRLR
jgi:hypothetical protein